MHPTKKTHFLSPPFDLAMTEDEYLSFFLTPSRVSLVPLPTPSCTRRSSLSSRLEAPLPPARKKLAWISLQGRLVGAEDATSARTIGGGLSLEEAAAWELFSPLQRVLVVAVVAAAANESRKGRVIDNLQRSVKIRDEVLQDMQKKFDDLCEQMYSEDPPTIHTHKGSSESDEFKEYMMSETKVTNFCSSVCSLPQLNPDCGVPPLSGNLSNWSKDPGAELCKVEILNASHPSMGEPEERRMSDLSDFSSVSSSVDIHQLLSTLAEEQNIYNLRKECQQKDAIIDKLTAEAHESSIAHSKRISEFEEIIRRKNMIITKLKKDKLALEQRVIQLMRERRPSTASNTENKTTPAMATNILYDMSSSSPSSSDSDTPVHKKDWQPQVSVKSDSQPSTKSQVYSNLPTNKRLKHQSVSPVKASHIVSRADSIGALRPKRLVSASADSKRTRRQSQQESSCVASQKRWVYILNIISVLFLIHFL